VIREAHHFELSINRNKIFSRTLALQILSRLSKNLPVDNVVSVAVVDTRKNLFHKNSCILLCEFTSGDNFVKELTTFANSMSLSKTLIGYSVTM